MSTPFLEERLAVCVRLGAQWEDDVFVASIQTAGGADYRPLKNPLLRRTFDVSYIKDDKELVTQVAGLWYRVWGRFAGFRVKAYDDFTTAVDGKSAYAATDCAMRLVSDGVYQLTKQYGRDKPALPDFGYIERPLYKPVSGKVAVGVGGAPYPATQWSVDITTGKVTLAANKARTITAIAKGSSTVLTIGAHSYLVGESAVASGVLGMTQINGLRAPISAIGPSTITLPINSTLFSDYTGGGSVQTRPLGGEAVTAGCEFDIPCFFDSAFRVSAIEGSIREAAGLQLVEILKL